MRERERERERRRRGGEVERWEREGIEVTIPLVCSMQNIEREVIAYIYATIPDHPYQTG